MRRRYLQNIYHANVNASLTVANIARIKSGITINIGVSVKKGEYAGSIIDNSVITYDGLTDASSCISTKVSCSVPINAANIVSTNFDDKIVGYKMDC